MIIKDLKKCSRTDDIFYNICKFINIHNIDTLLFDSQFTDRHLAYINRKITKINKLCMSKYIGA